MKNLMALKKYLNIWLFHAREKFTQIQYIFKANLSDEIIPVTCDIIEACINISVTIFDSNIHTQRWSKRY